MNTRVNPIVLGFIGIVAIFVAGCDTVTMWQPLSAAPQPIDREQFEGAWRVGGSGIFHIRFGEDGVGRIAAVDWENGEFSIRHGQMIVTEGQAHNFLSVRFQEDDEWQAYHLAQYRFTEQGDLILWLPNIKTFEKAVEDNALRGMVEMRRHSTHVVLTGDPAVTLLFIDDPENLTLFDYRNPIVVKKLAGVE